MQRPKTEANEQSDSEQSKFETDSGIPVKSFYVRDNESELGEPGKYPFTRGIYPEMFRQKLWTMREYTGFGTAADTNKRFKYLMNGGQTGLSVAFDLPTQLGLDSDDPRAEGEVGKVGVAISTVENMGALFSGIPIDQVSTSMTINATACTMLSMYVAVGEASGVARSLMRGTTQNDILKEYAARNTYIYPPDQSFGLCIDIIAFCADEMPRWHPISISGYHIREAGANAVQELAFTFADAIEYVKAVVQRGYSIDSFCDQLSFFFACRNDFAEEVAKFRAARRIWAKIVKERFGSMEEKSMKLKFHAQTSGETLTAQQPLNNVVRVSIQALAAVLGGVQSLHTNSYDEALGLPTEESVTIALRTQEIIADESGLTRSADPLGGSYYMETLTDEIEARALEELDRVEKMGGALEAIKAGYIQREIQKSAYEYQKDVDQKRKIIVGVNKYVSEARSPIRIQKIPERSVSKQLQDLGAFKRKRNKIDFERAISKLEEEAAKDVSQRTNLVPLVINAVKSRATTGEISKALGKAFGEYHASSVV